MVKNIMIKNIMIDTIARMTLDYIAEKCPAIKLISREEFNVYAVDMTIELGGKIGRLDSVFDENMHLPDDRLVEMVSDEIKNVAKELGDVCINSYHQNHPARTA